MVKSILVNENIHELITDKQYELQKAGMRMGISELAEKVLALYINEYTNKLLKKE